MMKNFIDASVYRSGKTANNWTLENNEAVYKVVPNKRQAVIRTELKSKGGGITELQIVFGIEDIKNLVREFSKKFPGELVGVLIECAAEAYKKNGDVSKSTKKLEAERNTNQLELVTTIIEDMKAVKKSIDESSFDSDEQDDKKNKINKVIENLDKLYEEL